jgi:sRNA-binding protein
MIESQVKNNNVNIGDKDQGSNKKKKQHYVMLPEKYDNAFEELSSKYPKLFIKDKPKVLKIGIDKDILADSDLKMSQTQLRKFFKVYISSKGYRELHVENSLRYDLEGNEVGVVTKENIEALKRRAEETKKYREVMRLKKKKMYENKLSEKNKIQNNSGDNKDKAKNMEVAEPPYITNNNVGNFKDSNNKKPKLGLKKL